MDTTKYRKNKDLLNIMLQEIGITQKASQQKAMLKKFIRYVGMSQEKETKIIFMLIPAARWIAFSIC